MYAWYKRNNIDGKIILQFDEQCSLGGCNNGVIAQELEKILVPTDTANMGWILSISEIWNSQEFSFIIDIKPNSKEVFLCELDKVYGFSYEQWSPIMLRLKLLHNDVAIEDMDKESFTYPENPSVIYTMLYLNGSICNGKLTGTWSPPFGKITAVLFWPEAMSFFFEEVKKIDPHFLEQNIQLIQSLK